MLSFMILNDCDLLVMDKESSDRTHSGNIN